MPNKRKCKNKECTKGHDGKPKYFTPSTVMDFPRQEWCCDDCRIEIAVQHFQRNKANQEKAKKRAEKERRARKSKQKRERLYNDLKHQVTLTQIQFNKLIRILDKGKPCISSGRYVTDGQAGHYLPTSGHPELRFDPRNCHLQSAGDNLGEKWSSKRRRQVVEGYESGLRERYGQKLLDWLHGPHKAKHYTCDDLRALRKEFIAEIKYIEENGSPSRDWRALDE